MNRCYFCQGTVKSERITHIHRWKGQVIILEDVPADVCQQCGEGILLLMYYKLWIG
jgi:YgiT-type zinc finger domain-containing protein